MQVHKATKGLQVVSIIDVINDEVVSTMEVDLVDSPLVGVSWNLGSKVIKECNEVVASLIGRGSYIKIPCKLDFDLNNHKSPPAKPSNQCEINSLPSHIWYVFLGKNNTLPIIVTSDVSP